MILVVIYKSTVCCSIRSVVSRLHILQSLLVLGISLRGPLEQDAVLGDHSYKMVRIIEAAVVVEVVAAAAVPKLKAGGAVILAAAEAAVAAAAAG